MNSNKIIISKIANKTKLSELRNILQDAIIEYIYRNFQSRNDFVDKLTIEKHTFVSEALKMSYRFNINTLFLTYESVVDKMEIHRIIINKYPDLKVSWES